MIEIISSKQTKAIIITPIIATNTTLLRLSPESRLEEACGLALAINLQIEHKEFIALKEIKPATFFSQGFIERIQLIIQEKEIELMIVDGKLSPIQQRNLERKLNIKIIDRTALILEIFGERAKTREGALQVELAHLTYQRSRLVRSWTHLERQRGGAGFLGGPGEKQMELDRRVIDDKIIRIKKDLEKVKQTRAIQRGARQKIPYPTVALVGYTNAGKSSLFNYLANSNVMAEDMLFATLDPTMRKIKLPNGKEVILSDTVGFISDLPHELIMAFRATLEEVLNAEIILHVRDISNPDNDSQCKDVLEVLAGLGLEEIKSSEKYIEVFNKADLLTQEDFKHFENATSKQKNKVLTSAISGYGCERLLNIVGEKLNAQNSQIEVILPPENGKLQAWLYQNAEVINCKQGDENTVLSLRISLKNLARLKKSRADFEPFEIKN